MKRTLKNGMTSYLHELGDFACLKLSTLPIGIYKFSPIPTLYRTKEKERNSNFTKHKGLQKLKDILNNKKA